MKTNVVQMNIENILESAQYNNGEWKFDRMVRVTFYRRLTNGVKPRHYDKATPSSLLRVYTAMRGVAK